jgi:hypothetical protein
LKSSSSSSDPKSWLRKFDILSGYV